MLAVRRIATPEDTNLKLKSASIILAIALGVLGTELAAGAADLQPPRPSDPRTAPMQVQQDPAHPILAQEFPAPPFYQLLPHHYPYPLIRTCYTYAGICVIPFTIQPGTPCYCEASNGVRVSGVCTK